MCGGIYIHKKTTTLIAKMSKRCHKSATSHIDLQPTKVQKAGFDTSSFSQYCWTHVTMMDPALEQPPSVYWDVANFPNKANATDMEYSKWKRIAFKADLLRLLQKPRDFKILVYKKQNKLQLKNAFSAMEI